MFDELNKYRENSHFFFNPKDNLAKVCNAPTNKNGVILVYALKKGKVELIYIGSTGKFEKDGSVAVNTEGLGGIKDNIINEIHFGKPRETSWPAKMIDEEIEALDVYWYVTHGDKYNDPPKMPEKKIMQVHLDVYGRYPRWNEV